MPHDERTIAEEHLREMADKERPMKKSGILGRLRTSAITGRSERILLIVQKVTSSVIETYADKVSCD